MNIQKIPVALIDEGPNCREFFGVVSCRDLARDIDSNGLLQAIVVRPKGDRYELVAGFRRFMAVARILRWETIPANVVEVDDSQAARLNLTENLARKSLNPVEEARAVENLYPENRFSLVDAGRELGRDPHWVQARRHVLKLPEHLQKKFASGAVPISRVGSILKSPDPEAAAKALEKRKNPRMACKELRRRSKGDIGKMMDRLANAGYDPLKLEIKLLAWVNGWVDDDVLNNLIQLSVESHA
ncbi:Chromosome-partitioning protein Spo0J [Caulifigura coniformis]|uniref:Chromosome-partitioning protein Spo0J n=1 Tax=Caulifigura coniformis TaxID=2527983 RepID=A0A517SDU3_9PLAN|nr:ParB/RepB/Spo0J family partition protein [Caulifigura coniformis]QDT54281.1 Chromosome-partitioning protein Spo0J [Caulifigura coniformis]